MPSRIRFLFIILALLAGSLACQRCPLPAAILGTEEASPTPFISPAIPPPTAITLFATGLFNTSPAPASPGAPTTLPPASLSPAPSNSPASSLTPRPSPSALQLQVFEELWAAVNDNYLYPDFNGLDWNAVHLEYRQRIQAGMSDEEFYTAMKDMIYRLGDDHSSYLSPQEVTEQDAQYTGSYDYAGIGVMISAVPERNLGTILLVFPDSPADRAGLQPHDNLLEIDGQSLVEGLTLRRELLRGPEGTTIQVTVQSPGQPPRQVSITRKRIDGTLPILRQNMSSPGGKRIGYIFLPTFNDQNIDDQVGQALIDLSVSSPLDGLIIDDRQNVGGSSEVLLDTLAYFTNGPVGSLVTRQGEHPLAVTGKDIAGSQRIPLVVMIDQGAISFGEVFAGVLKDLGRAFLIGEQTAGNVEVLAIYNLPDGSRAMIASMTFRPLNQPGQDWEKTGILPDMLVLTAWDQFTLENDPAIQAALQYFDKVFFTGTVK